MTEYRGDFYARITIYFLLILLGLAVEVAFKLTVGYLLIGGGFGAILGALNNRQHHVRKKVKNKKEEDEENGN